MNQTLPPFAPQQQSAPEAPPQPGARRQVSADDVMTAYVGYLAGCFGIGRLAASRRLNRAGVKSPLLNDS